MPKKNSSWESRFEGVIFDMDGVLINSEHLHRRVEVAVMKSFGAKMTLQMTKAYLGTKFEYEFTDLIKKFRLKVELEEVLSRHTAMIEKYYYHLFPATPHIKTVLKDLKRRKYKLAVATSSSQKMATAALKRLNLIKYFDTLVFAEDVKNGKPDPEPFLKAAEKLNIAPNKAVAIEDAINGFKAAKAAKMHLVAYKTHHNNYQDYSLADKTITDLRKLSGYLKNPKGAP